VLYIFFLPEYCSEMNKIELEWQQLKNHELVGKMFDIISGYTGMMLTVDG